MQKNPAVLLLMPVLVSATQWPQTAFPQAGMGREFGEGWVRKSISFQGCHFKKNEGVAVAGEEARTGEQSWQLRAGLAPSLGAVLPQHLCVSGTQPDPFS